MHVARRIEEVHAAETRFEFIGETVRQFGDRQTRCVAREDRLRRDVWRDLLVQVVLPFHALGDGFDHQVAVFQLRDVVVVVRRFDVLRVFLRAERRGRELLQILYRLQRDRVLRAFFCRKVE
jgi:hypothetical protein